MERGNPFRKDHPGTYHGKTTAVITLFSGGIFRKRVKLRTPPGDIKGGEGGVRAFRRQSLPGGFFTTKPQQG